MSTSGMKAAAVWSEEVVPSVYDESPEAAASELGLKNGNVEPEAEAELFEKILFFLLVHSWWILQLVVSQILIHDVLL